MNSQWKHVHTSRLLAAVALIAVIGAWSPWPLFGPAAALADPTPQEVRGSRGDQGGAVARSAVETADIRGNNVFNDDAIRGLLSSSNAGASGVKRVQSAYIQRGYLLATIQVETVGSDSSLIVHINEGEPARIGNVAIHGMESFSEERLRGVFDVRSGDEFRPDALERSVGRVLELYDYSGFPFAQVWIDNLELDMSANAVDLSVLVVEGSGQGISGVSFEGLEHTRKDLAVKLTGLKTGEPYNGEQLRESYLRLTSSGVFDSVAYPTVRISPDGGGVDVLIKVEEPSRNNSFSAALGYADREGDEDKVISGFVDLDLSNIGGTLRDFAINWRNDGKGRSQTEIGFRERFFLGKRMSMGVMLEQIGQDTLFTWQSVGIESAAPIGRLWGGLFGVNLSAHGDRNTFSEGPQASSRRVRVIAGVNFVEGKETHGNYVEFRTRQAFAHKWIRMRDDSPEESVTQFISEIRAAATAEVARHLQGHIEVNYKGLESPETFVPLSEQFYVGGAGTIRGYRENQYHGRRTAYARTELRVGSSAVENGYVFIDAGYVLQEMLASDGQVLNPEIYPVGYGFGLRTQSRIGNIDLSFGVGEQLSLQQTKVHVILNRSF